MPRQGPRRLLAGERDRRLAEEVLYLHSLWHRAGPAAAPIQPRSDRALSRKERKRLKIDQAAAAEPALAPPPPAASRETLTEAAGASAPPTANPPPPTTPPGPLAQREAVPCWVEFTNRDREEEEAARYFTGLFQRDARLRGHYTRRWRDGRFQCMVCAAAGAEVGMGKAPRQFRVQSRAAARQFRGCLPLVRHAHNPPRSRGRHGRYGRHGAHRALAAVVCRLLGWDIEDVVRRRIVIDPRPRATAGVQHAKENDGAGENNGFSTGDDSCSIDEDEDSEDEESVDEEEYDGAGENEGFSTGDDSYSIDEEEDSDDEESVDEEEDIETGITDPATDGDEEDSEIESDEEYAEKEDHENRMEDSSTDGDEDANELEISKETGQKEADNSITRKRDTKIRDGLLSITHAKPVETISKKMEVRKRSLVPKHKEVLIPGIKFNEDNDKAKRKAPALSYQGLKSSTSGVVKVKVNQQPSNKGKQSKTNETGASATRSKRRKAKQLAKKQLAKKQGGCLNS